MNKARNLYNILQDVKADFENDPLWALQLAAEIEQQFQDLEADYLACKKIAAKNKHFLFALRELTKNSL